MRILILTLALVSAALWATPPKPETPRPDSPAEALLELQAGNCRWSQWRRFRTTKPSHDATLRETLAAGQDPFAVVVCCSDSRVDETMIFDQEPGRLFVVREAGNSPDLQSVASVDYGVGHLRCKVVLVMGHASCGAVKAVKEAGSATLPGNLWVFQQSMEGLLEAAPQLPGETDAAYVNRLAETNAIRQARALFAKSPEIEHMTAMGEISVVPAFYDLATGKVTFKPAVAPLD